ncbi:hypothetical protein GOP47_0002960 [Adiantum capillus-veneris]|uniref:Uncharacterized protein n=1 Tax=Adiantum capillus-veneris TaxID=13818 RepID=A0A9D4VD21_ADICA|nr:hypothetical protein GOP47_0002960 [Adiantum capillus-veneris]
MIVGGAVLLLPTAFLQGVNANDRAHGGGIDPQSTQYVMKRTSPNPYVREVARCFAHNPRCHLKLLKCPAQCPKRVNSKFQSAACFIDCSRKCQTTCKRRKPNCNGYSAMCYELRFVGGDGVMFYFHGKANEDFCLVSDYNVHINAHFIGTRPQGRPRDFTWVQALGILFDRYKFSVAAKKVANWDNSVDQMMFTFNGEEVTIPIGNGAMWRSPLDDVRVERVSEVNAVHVTIEGIMSASVEVVPISKEEDRVHNYTLPEDDVFAHLNVQFGFVRLSATVDGVLGQTYKPNYESPVKIGVPMPIMGGEAKFKVSSLFATDCLVNRFSQPFLALSLSSSTMGSTKCTTTSTSGGILCRR